MWLMRIVSSMMMVHMVLGQQAPSGGYYTTRYDHLDVERILNQKRLVHYYAACLLDRGPCTPQGVEFKRILPEALKTNCQRCTEKQRFVTVKSIRRLKKEYPDVWQQLSDLWDPTGEYVRNLEEGSIKQSFTPNLNTLNTVSDNVESSPSNLENNSEKKVVTKSGPSPTPQVVQVKSTVAGKPLSFSTTTPPDTPPAPVVILSRFGDEDEQQNEIPSSSTTFSTTPSSTTTTTPTTATTTTTIRNIVTTPPVISTFATSTAIKNPRFDKPTTYRIIQERPTTKRILYNYDFGVTIRPLINKLNATNGINMVIKGVNTIIQPISNIAGRVITAGTDFAGIVLNALGVRKTYPKYQTDYY